MEKPVLFEINGQTTIITLNRPERRNAINQAMLIALYNHLKEVAANEAVKVAIITGSGKSFCSGIDLDCLQTDNLFDPRGDGLDLIDIFDACPKPIIGAVNGYAITGGFEIALNCDFLIASKEACFADTHAKVGIHPGWRITQLLQQAVGVRRAKQLSLTCERISADQALKIGLVNEVMSSESLMPRAMELASQICSVNYEMMMNVKQLIEYRQKATFENACANERNGFKTFLKSFG